MDKDMDILDDNSDESQSNSDGSLPSSDEKSSVDRPGSADDPQLLMLENFAECLVIGAQLWISSTKKKTIKRLERDPNTISPRRRTNRVHRRASGSDHSTADDPQAGSSLMGFSNVAGLYCSTPFLQQVDTSSSASSGHGSGLSPKFALPTPSSEPNLYVRQELRAVQPKSDPKDLQQQSLASDPSFLAMCQQFQNLHVSTEPSSKFGSMQPLHFARAGHIQGPASSVASTSQSFQMGPTAQDSGVTVKFDDGLKSIVITALHQIGYILEALTNQTDFPMSVSEISNSLVAHLEKIAFAFKTIEQHPNSNRIFARIGLSLSSRIFRRITDVTADVRVAINDQRAGWRFDLGRRLEGILVEDFKNWFRILDQFLNEI